MTAFFPRPTEYGPHQKRDYAAEQDWDVVATDIEDMASKLGGCCCGRSYVGCNRLPRHLFAAEVRAQWLRTLRP